MIAGLIFIGILFGIVQIGVHLEAKACRDTRKIRREIARQREHNRLFWSIRNMEKEIYGKWLS